MESTEYMHILIDRKVDRDINSHIFGPLIYKHTPEGWKFNLENWRDNFRKADKERSSMKY